MMFGPKLLDVVRNAAVGELTVKAISIERAAELVEVAVVIAPEGNLKWTRAPLRFAHHADDQVLSLREIVDAGDAGEFPVRNWRRPGRGGIDTHGKWIVDDLGARQIERQIRLDQLPVFI